MIRFFFRWLFRFVILGIVAITALVLSKDVLLREWLVYRLSRITGLETHLQGLQTSWLSGTVTLSDLRLYNTAEFGGGPLIVLPDLHLELDLRALLHRELHLKLARVHVADFALVRNREGQTNVVEVWNNLQNRANALDAAIANPPGFEFTGIETLNLTVGSVHWVDLANTALDREIRVNVRNEIVPNVRSISDLGPLLLRLVFRQLTDGLRENVPPPSGRRSPARHGPGVDFRSGR